MNIRELINSNAKVVKGYPDNNDGYKDFRYCDLGGIISINTTERIDRERGIRHMVMYMTTSLGSNRKNFIRQYAPHQSRFAISTYTVAISVSGYYTREIPLENLETRDTHYGSGDDLYNNPEFLSPSEIEIRKLNKNPKFKENLSKAKTRLALYKRLGLENEKERLQEEWNKYLRSELLKLRVDDFLKDAQDVRFLEHPYRIVSVENNIVKIENIITLDNEVRVNCTCGQFYYTFAWYNADHKALIGPKPPQYIKSIYNNNDESLDVKRMRYRDSVTVRNKNKQPGLCKHLQFFLSYLMQQGIIEASKTSSRQVRTLYKTTGAINKIKQIEDLSESVKFKLYRRDIEEKEGKDLYKLAKEERANFNLEEGYAKRVTHYLLRRKGN